MTMQREYPSLWNVFANPMFRRYAASRLRPMRVLSWLFITQVLVGFLWITTVLAYFRTKSFGGFHVDFQAPAFQALLRDHGASASLIGWSAVLIVQGLLVIMKGTFSVAVGVAREANEGMIESQRLTPLPIAHKVVGQLLGLPLLETVVAASLLPWSLLSWWLGGLSASMMVKVYVLLATSAVFHHSIGLVAGTVIRQKILAGTISQMLVVALHFILPLFRGVGIGMISYLGVEAAIQHEIVVNTPQAMMPHGILSDRWIHSPVRFFQWDVELPGYHWLLTVSALAFLIAILVRRWRDENAQLLGKVGTTLVVVWLLTLTSGELLPNLAQQGMDSVLPNNRRMHMIGQIPEAMLVAGVLWMMGFGALLGLLNLLFVSSITPSPEARVRVMRQRVHGGEKQAGWLADGRDALLWVVALSLLMAVAWSQLTQGMLHAPDVAKGHSLSAGSILWLMASLVVPACVWHALALWRGWKQTLLIGFAVWVIPLMIVTIGGLMSANLNTWPKWVGGLSGLTLPAYALSSELDLLQGYDFRLVFHVSLAMHAVAAVVLYLKARQRFTIGMIEREVASIPQGRSLTQMD